MSEKRGQKEKEWSNKWKWDPKNQRDRGPIEEPSNQELTKYSQVSYLGDPM